MANPIINIFHLLVIAPFFLYIARQKNQAPEWVFTTIIFVALGVIVYHAYRYLTTMKWINLMHIVIGFILLYFSFNHQNLTDAPFTIFYLASFIVAIWHSILLYNKMSGSV